MRPRVDENRLKGPEQIRLPLFRDGGLVPAVSREAARRGLDVEASVVDRDRLLVGEIGVLIAGLNKAMDVAAGDGVDIVIVPHYQPTGADGRKRCILRGSMRRVALNVAV